MKAADAGGMKGPTAAVLLLAIAMLITAVVQRSWQWAAVAPLVLLAGSILIALGDSVAKRRAERAEQAELKAGFHGGRPTVVSRPVVSPLVPADHPAWRDAAARQQRPPQPPQDDRR